jgi:hypothetical protein
MTEPFGVKRKKMRGTRNIKLFLSTLKGEQRYNSTVS